MEPVERARSVVDFVYVHAPFCARRCRYCDFAVTVERAPDPGLWLEALAGELGALEEEGRVGLSPSLRTVYVGGGTPSLLGAEAMGGLAGLLGRDRLDHETLEWSAEANPESFTREVAEGWRRAGVTRVSLGSQSFQGRVLRWMGRLHGPEGAASAVATARAAGFDNVSVDLIFGLPAELERDWRADIDRVVALEVPHVSLYGLTAEPATPLGRDVAEGRVAMPDEERYREEYLAAHDRLTSEGFRAYEVSNFARPGSECRHNLAYWEGAPYLGLGSGAHSYLPPERRWNLRDWGAYRSEVHSGRLPLAGREIVEGQRRRLERIWLDLRSTQGVALSSLHTVRSRRRVDEWVRAAWARCLGDRVTLTAEGWLVLDRLAVELDSDLDRLVED